MKFPIFLDFRRDFFEFSWKNRQNHGFWRIIAEYSPAGEDANIRGEASTRPQLAKRIVTQKLFVPSVCVCGAKQDFCSNIWSAKQGFC